ncbi:DnaJ C-terminal domain-containing protein [Brevundimonas sp. Root1279]|uniref:DnaJ C-terminal domain-containing protein n=1 Tax=Brevundimonas sp. Root1279 TaxID=1736443 RepID=UPI0007009346|nr:DnaJ C-terminal domain-containing protein [Brevundimonas sp. Root1279]KQW83976.1 molecular chaperone DnaJ [Brevundimonas sp. Root1279]
MGHDALTLADAWSVLGLDGPTEPRAATAAFRTALKAARPELHDGDEARFRRVIEAWRLVRHEDAPASAAPMPPAAPVIVLTPLQAVKGGTVTVQLGGKTLKVRAPKGLRSGDTLRLRRAAADGADLTATVLIRGADGLSVVGDDLYMDWPVAPRTLEDGGRLEIETHAGPRSAWVTAGQETLRLRLKDLGLPPRGKRTQGHLFVTLKPCDDAPSAAEDLLDRFTRVWTPDRLAA